MKVKIETDEYYPVYQIETEVPPWSTPEEHLTSEVSEDLFERYMAASTAWHGVQQELREIYEKDYGAVD